MPRPPLPHVTARGDGHRYDADAGPLVRPYTAVPHLASDAEATPRDPTFAKAERPERLDLVAQVVPVADAGSDPLLGPEHTVLLAACRRAPRTPLSVAELAVTTRRPVGVVRVLLGDLCRRGHLRVYRPACQEPTPRAAVVGMLSEVIDGIRAL